MQNLNVKIDTFPMEETAVLDPLEDRSDKNQKMARIRAAVANGTYSIDACAVAQNVIRKATV